MTRLPFTGVTPEDPDRYRGKDNPRAKRPATARLAGVPLTPGGQVDRGGTDSRRSRARRWFRL
jgi:hypothetical protein